MKKERIHSMSVLVELFANDKDFDIYIKPSPDY